MNTCNHQYCHDFCGHDAIGINECSIACAKKIIPLYIERIDGQPMGEIDIPEGEFIKPTHGEFGLKGK